jgi:hypothetical protein
MSLYFAARLLHIVGALFVFTALGVDLAGLTALGTARTTDQVRRALEAYRLNRLLGPLSLLCLLVPGIYMATAAWAWQAWIQVSFAGVILIFISGAVLTRRRLAAVAPALKGEDRPLDVELERLVRDPMLRASFVGRTFTTLAIVSLMATKPDLVTSLLVIGGAILLAIAASTSFWTRAKDTQSQRHVA